MIGSEDHAGRDLGWGAGDGPRGGGTGQAQRSDASPVRTPRLLVDGATITFGGLAALSNVSIAVHKAEVTGLIGPNGAGKSTLINVICGLYELDSGKIYLDGERIDGRGPQKTAEAGIARTFQNLRLFGSMTVLENVLAGMHSTTASGVLSTVFRTRKMRREELSSRNAAMDVLARFGLAGKAQVLVSDLSYPEQKGVEICRAVVREPSLILLDEPAAGVGGKDRRIVADMLGVLREAGDMGILLIEHDVGLVMDSCDAVAVLSFGRKIADGAPEEVRRDPEVIGAYLGEEE